MSLKLPTPPGSYDAGDQAETRRQIQRAVDGCIPAAGDVRLAPGRGIIMRDSAGNAWRVTVGTNGALTTTQVAQT